MKLILFSLVALVVLGVGGLFVLKSPNGEPWLSFEDFKPDTRAIESLRPNLEGVLEKDWSLGGAESKQSSQSKPVEVYRWQQADGTWVYSDSPPPAGEHETVAFDPNANIIQSSEAELPVASEQKPSGDRKPATLLPRVPSLSGAQGEDINQRLQDLQKTIDQYDQQLQKY